MGRLAQLIAKYPRESWFFVFASFINSFGSSFMWPLTTLYVHNVMNRSYSEAGLVLLLQSVAAIFGQLAGGALFYRVGVKRLLVSSLVLTSCAQLSLIGISHWYTYIGVMMTIGFLNAITMPAIQAYIGFRWKEQRRELFNMVYVGNNIGMAVGTSVAGLLATLFSFGANFTVNGLSTLGFAVFFYFFMKREAGDAPQLGRGRPNYEKGYWELLLNVKLYLFMAVGSMLLFFSTSVWNTGVAPFINEHGMGMGAYSFLWTVNGIVIFAGQPLIVLLNRYLLKSLSSRLIGSAVGYSAGFALILLSQNYTVMIVGMIICTFGEMLKAPTIPAFVTEKAGMYSPFYLGVVGAIGTAGRLVGPYALATSYDHGGIHTVLLFATLGAVIASLMFSVHASFHAEPRTSGLAAVEAK